MLTVTLFQVKTAGGPIVTLSRSDPVGKVNPSDVASEVDSCEDEVEGIEPSSIDYNSVMAFGPLRQNSLQ